MYYSLIGILALILLFIINYGIFFRRADQQKMRALRPYRFLLSLLRRLVLRRRYPLGHL